MNCCTLYCYNNLIHLIDHYLGVKNAAKSAKATTGKALDETQAVGRKGK